MLQKTTRLADFEALSFDWLILLLKCQVGELVQAALSVIASLSDPLKNSKWNH